MPAGGQFAPTNRPEARGIDLSEDPPGGAGLGAAAVLAEATRWGNRYARRYGVEADDVVGEAAARFYGQRARRETDGPSHAAVAVNDAAYLNTLARSIALQAMGADRSSTRKAWRSYRERCDQRMQEVGHELSTAEEDVIAAEVRAAQAPRRRAPAEFHRPRRVASLDASLPGQGHGTGQSRGQENGSLGSALAGTDDTELAAIGVMAPGDRPDHGALAEQVERLAEADEHAAARRLVWDALAQLTGAPTVQRGSMTERKAAAARAAMRSVGGPAAVASSYVRGLAGQPETDALFAPFGELGDEEKDRIAAVLAERRHLAGELWDLALRAATVQRDGGRF